MYGECLVYQLVQHPEVAHRNIRQWLCHNHAAAAYGWCSRELCGGIWRLLVSSIVTAIVWRSL